MPTPEAQGENISYSMKLRQENPEKMAEIENKVREFLTRAPLLQGENLDDTDVARVANFTVNKLKRLEGATDQEMDKTIEEALYEGVGERLKLKQEGMEGDKRIFETAKPNDVQDAA